MITFGRIEPVPLLGVVTLLATQAIVSATDPV